MTSKTATKVMNKLNISSWWLDGETEAETVRDRPGALHVQVVDVV